MDRFVVEFVGADGAMRCEPLTRCGGLRFEEVAPARPFPMFKGQRNFPGHWWSSTVGRHVGYESWLERDHVMLLDFDPAVVGIASQPFWLSCRAGVVVGAASAGGDPAFFVKMFVEMDAGGRYIATDQCTEPGTLTLI